MSHCYCLYNTIVLLLLVVSSLLLLFTVIIIIIIINIIITIIIIIICLLVLSLFSLLLPSEVMIRMRRVRSDVSRREYAAASRRSDTDRACGRDAVGSRDADRKFGRVV